MTTSGVMILLLMMMMISSGSGRAIGHEISAKTTKITQLVGPPAGSSAECCLVLSR